MKVIFLYGILSISFCNHFQYVSCARCPDSCVCSFRHTVIYTCTSTQLKDILESIPESTTRLDLELYEAQTSNGARFKRLPKLTKLTIKAEKIYELDDHFFANLVNLQILILTRTQLTVIGQHLLSGLKHLKSMAVIKNYNLRRIHPMAFKDLIELKSLNLNSNRLIDIENKTLSSLKNLLHLSFDNESLSILTQTMFENLVSLEKLRMTKQKIHSIQNNTFLHLKRLKSLSLHENRLTSIYKNTLNGLENLEIFSFYRNKISFIENGSFSSLSKLRIISLHYNSLSAINDSIFSGLVSLKTLTISSNNIASISCKSFSHLTQLYHLDLGNNKIRSLDCGLFQNLTEFKVLLLANNSIYHIGKQEFLGLKNLEVIELKQNELTYLDAELFKGQTNLQKLRLDDNHLSFLFESTFNDLVKLEHLNLRHNLLSSINESTFAALVNLRYLNIGQNRLISIQERAFANLLHLLVLNLDFNNLSSLAHDTLKETISIRYLYLESNQISKLPENIFQNLDNLVYIYLKNNRLSSFNRRTFKSNRKLYHVDLEDNEIKCSCYINEVMADLNAKVRKFNCMIGKEKVNITTSTLACKNEQKRWRSTFMIDKHNLDINLCKNNTFNISKEFKLTYQLMPKNTDNMMQNIVHFSYHNFSLPNFSLHNGSLPTNKTSNEYINPDTVSLQNQSWNLIEIAQFEEGQLLTSTLTINGEIVYSKKINHSISTFEKISIDCERIVKFYKSGFLQNIILYSRSNYSNAAWNIFERNTVIKRTVIGLSMSLEKLFIFISAGLVLLVFLIYFISTMV